MSTRSITWVGGPQKPRAPRSRRIDQRLWTNFKAVLHGLYYEQNFSLNDVAEHMLKRYNLKLTPRQCHRQFHEKWKWPGKRSKRAEIIAPIANTTNVEPPSSIIPETRPSSAGVNAEPLILDSDVTFEVTARESHFLDDALYNVRQNRLRDDAADSEASELCSLLTSSSSPSSRSFPHSCPPTPDQSEILPVRAGIYTKTPSRNAFRPVTPELHVLQESEFEDIFELFPPPPKSSFILPKKLLHRRSSILGNLLTFASTERSPRIEEEFIPASFITDHNDVEALSNGENLDQPSYLIVESDSEEEEDPSVICTSNPQELEIRAAEPVSHIQNSASDVHPDPMSEPTLFPHQHGSQTLSSGSCCFSSIAERALAQCAIHATLQAEPISIMSSDKGLSAVELPSETSKRTSILNRIENTIFRMDRTIDSDDITKMVRLADVLSAARMYDDSFIWSQVTWKILNSRDETELTPSVVYNTRTPTWLSIFTNMLKSCTRPEHLQLLAAAIEDVKYLESFPVDSSHSCMPVLYAYLGEALQRLSGMKNASGAAVGCWLSILLSSRESPNYLVKKIVTSSATARKDNSEAMSSETRQELDHIIVVMSNRTEQEAITSSLDCCVRKILAWCKSELKHSNFSTMVDSVDESFWTSSASPMDIARFERLAVFIYLCQSFWSQEHLDDQTFWMENVDVVNALQTMTTYTGLTYEAALAAILGIARPVLKPSTNPERSTMASRFSHSIERLYNDTAMKASGFGTFGRTMNINDLMDRYAWAGNSTSSLEEFDDPQYAQRVGQFLRERASEGLAIPDSQALQPVLGDLREGNLFCQDTLAQSTRSSQMSILSLKRRSSANRKALRNSGGSGKYEVYDCEISTTGLFGLPRSARYCSSAWNGSGTSMNRLSEEFRINMSLDKHVSTFPNQMI